MAGKVPSNLDLGYLCHSASGLSVSLDSLTYYGGYISPHAVNALQQ